jgi:hypothetical protein
MVPRKAITDGPTKSLKILTTVEKKRFEETVELAVTVQQVLQKISYKP